MKSNNDTHHSHERLLDWFVRTSLFSKVALVFAVCNIVLAVAFRKAPFVNHDVAHNLVGGGVIARGARMYIDWIDNNPPTIYWISALIATISDEPRLQILIYHLLVVGLWLLTLRRFLITPVPVLHEQGRKHLTEILIAFFFFGGGLHPATFGQRDQIVSLVLLADFLGRISKEQKKDGVFWQLFVGAALSMKPHYALPFLAQQFINLEIQPRFWIKRFVTICLFSLLPLLALLLIDQPAFKGMWQEVFVNHVSGLLTPYRYSITALTASALKWPILPFAGLWASIFICSSRTLERHFVLRLLFPVVAGLIAFFAQTKFWDYHLYSITVSLVISIIGWSQLRAPHQSRPFQNIVTIAALSICICTMQFWVSIITLENPFVSPKMIREIRNKQSVAIFSTSTLASLPTFYAGNQKNVRNFSYDFHAPGLYKAIDPGSNFDPLDSYIDAQVKEVKEKRPSQIYLAAFNDGFYHERQTAFYHLLSRLERKLLPEFYNSETIDTYRSTWISFKP